MSINIIKSSQIADKGFVQTTAEQQAKKAAIEVKETDGKKINEIYSGVLSGIKRDDNIKYRIQYSGYINTRWDLSLDKSYLVVIGDNTYNVKPVTNVNGIQIGLTDSNSTSDYTGDYGYIPADGTFWISYSDEQQCMIIATRYDSEGMLISIYETTIDNESILLNEESVTFGKIYGKWVTIRDIPNKISSFYNVINGHKATGTFYIDFNKNKLFSIGKRFIFMYNNDIIGTYHVEKINHKTYTLIAGDYEFDDNDNLIISAKTTKKFHFCGSDDSNYDWCYVNFIDLDDEFIDIDDPNIIISPDTFKFFEITNNSDDELFNLPINSNFIDYNSYITNKIIDNKPFGEYYEYNYEYEKVELFNKTLSFEQNGPEHYGITTAQNDFKEHLNVNDTIQIIVDGKDIGISKIQANNIEAGQFYAIYGNIDNGYINYYPYYADIWNFYAALSGVETPSWTISINRNYLTSITSGTHNIIINKIKNIIKTRKEKTKKLEEKYLGLHFYKEPIDIEIFTHDDYCRNSGSYGLYLDTKLIDEDLINESIDIEFKIFKDNINYKIIVKNAVFNKNGGTSGSGTKYYYCMAENGNYQCDCELYINEEIDNSYTLINLGGFYLYPSEKWFQTYTIYISGEKPEIRFNFTTFNINDSVTVSIIRHTYDYHTIDHHYINQSQIDYNNLKNTPLLKIDNTSTTIFTYDYGNWGNQYTFLYPDKLIENEWYTLILGDFIESVQCKKMEWNYGNNNSLTLNVYDKTETAENYSKIFTKWLVVELGSDSGYYKLVLKNTNYNINGGNKPISLIKGKIEYNKLQDNFIKSIIVPGEGPNTIKIQMNEIYNSSYSTTPNIATEQYTVCLGWKNKATNSYVTISGGVDQVCHAGDGTIAGGYGNIIGDTMGYNTPFASTISGGTTNKIQGSDYYQTIVGGAYNITQNEAEVAGGYCNISNTGEDEKDKTIFSIGNGNYLYSRDPQNIRHNAIEVRRNGDLYIPDTQLIGQPIPETEDTYDHMTIPMINVLEYIRSLEQRIKDLEEKHKDTE